LPHVHSHIDGKCYPSVTEIIHAGPKPWLEKWVARNPVWAPKKTTLSNKIGTEFHRCLEQVMKGQTPVPQAYIPRIKRMLQSFDSWFAVTDVSPYATEMKVYSHKHKYQGTFDMVAEINGVPMIVDFKSSSKISDDMGIQLAAYAYAYHEMTGLMLNTGLIVLVTKDKEKVKRQYKTVDGVRTFKRVKIKGFKLDVREFKIEESLFEKFKQLRDEYVEFPCPFLGAK